MKLKTFNAETLPTSQSREGDPTISFALATSYLNDKAVQALNLEAGMNISVHQSEDDPSEWFLEVDTKNGFPLKKASGSYKKVLVFASAALAHRVLESIGMDEKRATCRLVTEPIKEGKLTLYPIITSYAKRKLED